MQHPGNGRNDVPARLKRHFGCFNCPIASAESVDRIFMSIAEGYFSAERRFSSAVNDAACRLVPVARRVWNNVRERLLPTPAKFHYVFNLRDLSRIFQGMTRVSPSVVEEVPTLVSLYIHESQRVIADRFNDDADGQFYQELQARTLREVFGDAILSEALQIQWWTDFMYVPPVMDDIIGEVDWDADAADQDDFHVDLTRYEPLASMRDLKDTLEVFMEQYSEQVRGAGPKLVLFQDAMFHLIKISADPVGPTRLCTARRCGW